MKMSYKDAANFLGVSVVTLRGWVRRRRLPIIRYGKRCHRFLETDLVEFQEKNTIKAI